MRLLLMLSCVVMLCGQLSAQNRTITGKVTDAEGKPIPNASVLAKGSSHGTTTGEDGSFTINVSPATKVLIFSSVGMDRVEVSIGSNNMASAVLRTSTNKDLQEVVIVGYGTQKKSDMTASVAKVSGDQVANIPFSSVDDALQGKAAGLQVTGFTGQPGANVEVRIRGVGSYSASSQPLYVVDGIQINSGDLSAQAIISSTNVLANINPDDIESISVLKDAAATSIYGARGSNGVIIINTKRGKVGKTQFSATAEVGNNQLGDVPPAAKPIDGKNWVSLYEESYLNAGGSLANALTSVSNLGDTTHNQDWLKTVTRNGVQQQYNIAASGGEGKTTFYLSGGYFKQQASTVAADLTRWSSLIKVENNPSPRVNLSLSLQPSYTKSNGPLSNGSQFGNPVLSAFFLRPIQNPYNPDGTLNISTTSKNFNAVFNPLYVAQNNVHNIGNFSGIGNAQARISILDNLKFTSRMGVQYETFNEYQYDNPNHGDGVASHGRGFADYVQFFLTDFVNQLDYHGNLTSDLTLDAKAGYEAILSKSYTVTAAAQNFPTSRLDLTTIASTPTAGSVTGSDYSIASEIASISLNYKGRYILAGNYRRDGSSRFSPSNLYGTFPSVSIAWNASKENFLANASWLSDLKLRASYGSAGNAEIGNYSYLQQLTFGSVVVNGATNSVNYNNQPGGVFGTIGNVNLTWEKDQQADVGLDASFFKNRLSVTIDYYDKENSNLLFGLPLSLTTGFPTITENIGKLANKGIEFTVNATPVTTKDFSWDLSFNISHNKNEIKALPPGQDSILNGQFYVRPGYDVNTWYMRQWAGVDPANGNPLWYTDATKKATTSNYNAAQRVNTGKAVNPKMFGGFTNTFTYKGFSLSADLFYNFGNYVWDQWGSFLTDEVNPSYGKYNLITQRWTTPGQKTNVPKLIYGSANFSNSTSTRFLYKADYLRLRNIVFGYTLKPAIAKSLHVSSLRVYVRGTNLWTKLYDKNLTIDPEQGGSTNSQGSGANQGVNNLNIFYNKSLTAGINIGF